MPYVIFFFNVCEKRNMGEESWQWARITSLLVGREDILIESVEPANFITSEPLKFL